jgi:hypothetical protein
MLAPVLVQRLVQWQTAFDRSFRYDQGWASAEAMEQWANEATSLQEDLRAALPPGVVLVVDLWPLAGEPGMDAE